MSARRLRAYAFLLGATIIWAVAAPIIKFTLEEISPLPFLTYRFGLSALVALILLIAMRKNYRIQTKYIPMLLLYSVSLTTLSLGFLFLGLDRTTVLNLSLITLIGPLILSFAGSIFLHERMSKKEKIGAGIAFLGTALTVAEPILQSTGGLGTLEGNLFIACHLTFDITGIILLKKLLQKDFSANMLTQFSFIVGFATLLPIALFVMGPMLLIQSITSIPLPHHMGVWYMAFLSGTAAYWLRAQGQKTVKVEQNAIFGYIAPLITIPIAVIWLGEQITPLYILGALIISIGVLYAEFKFGHK